MFEFFKKYRKTILATLIFLILLVNVCVIMVSYISDYLKQSATEIVGSVEVDKVSFCTDKDYFKDVPAYTYDSISLAFENSFEYYLADAYVTSDGMLVCSASDDLKDVIGIDGKLGEHTYYDLLNYTILHKGKPTSYPIMPCEDFAGYCVDLSLTPVIYPHGFSSLEPIENILKTYEHGDYIVIMSDDFGLLRNISEKYPEIRLWYMVDEAVDEVIDNMNLLPDAQILFNGKNRKNNDETVERIKERGVSFGCYNVNKRSALKRYISLGASEIITSRFVKSR
ncbi:MAG: hypothetical protein IJS17_03805 [Clostridia bacterium]|nr:hypothetical protein [Clostridia bacterium]